MARVPTVRHVYVVGKINPVRRNGRLWATLGPVLLGIVLSIAALFWMPWEMVHPADASLEGLIGYAPLWSHRFEQVPGAHPDWGSASINLAIIWIICGAASVMFRMSTSD